MMEFEIAYRFDELDIQIHADRDWSIGYCSGAAYLIPDASEAGFAVSCIDVDSLRGGAVTMRDAPGYSDEIRRHFRNFEAQLTESPHAQNFFAGEYREYLEDKQTEPA